MIRRSLFFGLTLVLIVALVTLILQGRRQEKLQANKKVEVIKESTASPIRVYAPSDLEIVRSTVEFGKKSNGTTSALDARHEIEILNRGKVPYREIRLAFEYIDTKGKPLTTKTYSVSRTLLPATSLKVPDIMMDSLPLSAIDFKISILHADLWEKP
jgi:hypothetical protein